MAPQSPSIQSFFQPAAPSKAAHEARPAAVQQPPEPGDGFTEAEKQVHRPSTIEKTWNPPQEYDDVDISDLIPGPGCRTFMGRIVNFFDQQTPSKRPRAAKGCVKMIIKDDTGALTIRLWYANPLPALRLGHLVTIWTSHISNSEHGTFTSSTAPLFTSIFPERDRGCHLMLHEASDDGNLCKAPLGYRPGRPLRDLITLKNFIDGGYDIVGSRILVAVKWIGGRKKVTNKKGLENDVVSVGVFDHTAEATFTLWGPTTVSVTAWKTSQTILLFTSPGWRIDRKAWISLNASTCVDVDPSIEDAEWLRGFAQRITRREHTNPEFPQDIFDFEAALMSPQRVLWTLGDLDEFARAAPGERFMGYLSAIIMELNIVKYERRNMLLCNECCGVPLFANLVSTKCKQCEKQVALRINPRLLGPLIDETGTTTGGKLIVSTRAWEQLLGRTTSELVATSTEELRTIEQRLLFLRVNLVFGWAAEEAEGNVGRLCIWEVHA
ncbi:hypothetical protein NA57DRAFT_29494 [Rhizodiscina lignyota]|uniref:Uncharacterized protein n=1 Tax=Rhizodiscina lignyota TaxID=1504668 RepID=A0A9P4MGT0_9PEZI|nr:hypothetical protein NA57DRAFT_29494 [Rhizodiscina lignyota]